MDLFKELQLAAKNPFSIKSFYIVFVNTFIVLVVGIMLASFLSAVYA
ncbi:MAG TPA: hypothetical protein VIH52_02555 [Candidatus Nanoarchaeia archaeon]